MDRIDLHIEVDQVTYDDLTNTQLSEDSASIRERVIAARLIQNQRFADSKIHCNAKMDAPMVKQYCQLDAECEKLLKAAFDNLHLSARAYTRILKVARTIADLAGASQITAAHISEAVSYRSLDRFNRGQ